MTNITWTKDVRVLFATVLFGAALVMAFVSGVSRASAQVSVPDSAAAAYYDCL